MVISITLCLLSAPTPVSAITENFEFTELSESSPSVEPWWKAFNDPTLNEAIRTGLLNNYDLKVAAARIVQAEAAGMRALSPLLPQLTADANIRLSPADVRGFSFGVSFGENDGPSTFYNGSALLNARWQLDVWGRSYLAYRAARLNARAGENDRDSVALALTQQVANAYFDAVFAKQSIELVKAQIEANARLLELLELRFERGDTTGLDVLQQKQQLAARSAELPPLRIQLRVALQRLSILRGQAPSHPTPSTAKELPPLPKPPALGNSADLMQNRPDLRSALDRYEATREQASSALRGHLPTLNLDANYGRQFVYLDQDRPDQDNFRTSQIWGAGAVLSLPLFSGFDDVGQAKEAKGREIESLNSLKHTYLEAVGEVESAIINERETSEQWKLLREQSSAAEAAREESEARYLNGLTDYLTVLTALSAAQTAQRAVLRAQRSAISARLQLYQALGGPWTHSLVRRVSGTEPK